MKSPAKPTIREVKKLLEADGWREFGDEVIELDVGTFLESHWGHARVPCTLLMLVVSVPGRVDKNDRFISSGRIDRVYAVNGTHTELGTTLDEIEVGAEKLVQDAFRVAARKKAGRARENKPLQARMIEWAVDDHRRVVGAVLNVRMLFGYVGDEDTEIFVPPDQPPIRVRVIETDYDSIVRWGDHEWLDPCWDVTVEEPHPLVPRGFTSGWVYGTSYNAKTGEVKRDENFAELRAS